MVSCRVLAALESISAAVIEYLKPIAALVYDIDTMGEGYFE